MDDLMLNSNSNGGGGSGGGTGNTGENLLTNGDFEDGTTGWFTNYGDNLPEIEKKEENKFFFAEVTAANAEQPFLLNLSQGLNITQGRNTPLTFDASSDRANHHCRNWVE